VTLALICDGRRADEIAVAVGARAGGVWSGGERSVGQDLSPGAVVQIGASGTLERRDPLWGIAESAAVFGADVLCREIDLYFAKFPESSSVVIRHDDGALEILTRRRAMLELGGRLGHGRALYARRAVRELPGGEETLVLDGATTLPEAGVRALERDRAYRYDDIVVPYPDGTVGAVTVARLFGELARLHAHRAVHDRLTGLPNRELFVERMHAISGPVAALFIDLDDFKLINDSLGHSAGDELLIVVADRLLSSSDSGETVARLSGDEFGLLQPGGDEASALRTAKLIGDVLAVPVSVFGVRSQSAPASA
jgi:GGDEF domain-containing protein